jgi:transposase-like protein
MIKHWTMARKIEVIEHYQQGATLQQIEELFGIPAEEFNEWLRNYNKHGMYSLRVTKVMKYRRRDQRAIRVG